MISVLCHGVERGGLRETVVDQRHDGLHLEVAPLAPIQKSAVDYCEFRQGHRSGSSSPSRGTKLTFLIQSDAFPKTYDASLALLPKSFVISTNAMKDSFRSEERDIYHPS